MYFNPKHYFILIFWVLLLYTKENVRVNAGESEGDDVSDNFDSANVKTITNLHTESDKPIGFQNPWERTVDMILERNVTKRRRVKAGAGSPHRHNMQTLSQSIPRFLWNSSIPIFYAHTFTPKQKCYIKEGMARVNTFSCLPLKVFEIDAACASNGKIKVHDCLMNGNTKWTNKTLNTNFPLENNQTHNESLWAHVIVIPVEIGCSSNVGNEQIYKNYIRFGNECFAKNTGLGTVMHETIHAIGYHHEHTRQDRDKYVTIVKENIREYDYIFKNFEKADTDFFVDYGPYDLFSIMHYDAYAFSWNKTHLRTITVKNATLDKEFVKLTERIDLAQSDKAKIRAATHCKGKSYEEHLAAAEKIDKTNKYDVMAKQKECEKL